MNKQLIIGSLAALLLLPAMAGMVAAQDMIVDYQFLSTGEDPAGDWNVGSNWDEGTGNPNGFVPSGEFNERAFITSGGTAFLDTDLGNATSGNGPGGMFIGAASTLEIRNNGNIQFREAANNLADQSALIEGTLVVEGGGTIGMKGITFGSNANYGVNFTAATATPFTASTSAVLNGTLNLDFSGLANPLGTHTVLDAATVSGNFNAVNATGLGADQAVAVNIVNGGTNGRLVNAIAFDQLTLTVNRVTGAVSITNPHAAMDIDGFAIESGAGSLNAAGLSGLGAGWTNAGTNSSNQVAQGFEGTTGNGFDTLVGGGSSIGVMLYQRATPTFFQQDVEDLTFTYTNGDGIFSGKVEYVGGPKPVDNDIVLTIDDNGDAAILNFSNFSQEVEAYRITSADGVLSTVGWTSLADGGVDDGTWAESPLSGSSQLLEVQEGANPGSTTPGDNTTTFNNSTLFSLGNIYTGGVAEQDGITFEFLLAGDSELTAGSVVFGELPTPAGNGDFDNNGSVNGADFLKFQRDFPAFDLAEFLANYGTGTVSASVAVVPEPTSLVMLALAVCGYATRRQKRS